MTDLPNASAGITRPCPRCEAQPGESCQDKFGRTRMTTHRERKDVHSQLPRTTVTPERENE